MKLVPFKHFLLILMRKVVQINRKQTSLYNAAVLSTIHQTCLILNYGT